MTPEERANELVHRMFRDGWSGAGHTIANWISELSAAIRAAADEAR